MTQVPTELRTGFDRTKRTSVRDLHVVQLSSSADHDLAVTPQVGVGEVRDEIRDLEPVARYQPRPSAAIDGRCDLDAVPSPSTTEL